ncbi:hypothetical protein PCC7418_1020 [Halothece sp. PCC 7418]|uniref:hypothetical protein n=1 Tax=Halothece sp. (strain PCC 7418) TaxID=65093 RepID=UPI0002A07724|nr:hypothetical protein [Halothece sp. PCC 7418]AFZ43228.1 hypothetical protein PCC7418_1020 [Halothece sp. PCC 7418]
MDLDQQLEQLVAEAPTERGMPQVMEYAIAPILKVVAQQLGHHDYYILQNTEENWQVTTLRHRHDQNLTKRVIYGFPTLEDARTFAQHSDDPELMALPIPITHILFELLAFDQVDSVIFFDDSGNYENGVEIPKEKLEQSIREKLKQLKAKTEQPPANLA